jgi:anaerobic selenocysteine-containing dehydrogenase
MLVKTTGEATNLFDPRLTAVRQLPERTGVRLYKRGGKIVRVVPLPYGSDNADLDHRGKASASRGGQDRHLLGQDQAVRIPRLLPLKRVDFDPDGRNPQNRGKSGYEPISWDDALNMVSRKSCASKKTHGPSAIAYRILARLLGEHRLPHERPGASGTWWAAPGSTTIPTAGRVPTGAPSIAGASTGVSVSLLHSTFYGTPSSTPK